ncbi:MAG TPA: calcium-binding protein [Solirubrobacteraceae bacterium]|nr:calcium-binding protein [Solirubrobacteraceae bacterium]
MPAVVAVGTVMLSVPAISSADSVYRANEGGKEVLRFVNDTGLRNDVSVTSPTGSGYYEFISNRTLTPGTGCVAGSSDKRVQCSGASRIVLSLGAGNDEVNVNGTVAVPVDVDGGPGDDEFSGRLKRIDGGEGDDHIHGQDINSGGDISGGPGNDTLFSGGYISLDDVDNDTIGNVHSDIETIYGSNGDDVFVGNDGPQHFVGGEGDDVLVGLGGDDILEGHLGDDLISGGEGTDVLSGYEGYDVIDYSDHTDPVSVTLDGVANDGIAGQHENIGTDFEEIWGGDGDDYLAGSLFNPSPGYYSVDNVFDGGPGADTIVGGAGFDVVDYSLRTASISATLGGGAISGESGEHDTIADDVEGLIGGSGNDSLTGNFSDGLLWGGPGDDRLSDPGGEDGVDGEDGNDQIMSFDSATDDIFCGAGADTVLRDAFDTTADCETVTNGATAPPAPPTSPLISPLPATPAPAAPHATTTPTSDRQAPTVTVNVNSTTLRSAVSKGISLRYGMSEPGTIRLSLTVDRRTARKYGLGASTVIGTSQTTYSGSGTARIGLKLSLRAGKALGRAKSIKAVLTLVAVDRSGNRRTIHRNVTLRA